MASRAGSTRPTGCRRLVARVVGHIRFGYHDGERLLNRPRDLLPVWWSDAVLPIDIRSAPPSVATGERNGYCAGRCGACLAVRPHRPLLMRDQSSFRIVPTPRLFVKSELERLVSLLLAVELDPLYVDIIVNRFEEFTSAKAERQ